MLRHLGEDKAALAPDEAIRAVLKEGRRITLTYCPDANF